MSEQDNERIFRERIVPSELSHAHARQSPTVVFLLGQQGAGKTRIGQQIGAALDVEGGYVEIDTDVYKAYHPAYAELARTDDQQLAAHTATDGQRWRNRALDYVQQQRVNVLLPDTSQNPDYFVGVARAFGQAGYRVEVACLGVPEAMSRQGILARYHEQVRDRGHGRLTVPEKRARSYRGIAEAADRVDIEQLAGMVAVFRRGEDSPRYTNHLDEHGHWAGPPQFRQALTYEREQRPWTVTESQDFLRTQRLLRQQMSAEFTDELREISRLAEPLLHPRTTNAASRQAAGQAATALRPPSTPRSTGGSQPPAPSPSRPPPQRPDVQQRPEGPSRGR